MIGTKAMGAYILLLCCACFLFGCGGASRPTKFYMLSSIADTSMESQEEQHLSVIVGPINVPPYLNRDQIIGRRPGVEVTVYDFDHWAEPLSSNLKRVLIANLSLLLGTAEIYDFDRRNLITADYQVEVDIHRFDFTDGGKAVLYAFWTVYNEGGEVLQREKTIIEASPYEDNIDSKVAAQNLIISDLSRKIAAVILSLEDMEKGKS